MQNSLNVWIVLLPTQIIQAFLWNISLSKTTFAKLKLSESKANVDQSEISRSASWNGQQKETMD